MYLVLLFAAAALLGDSCRSANVNKHMRLLSEIDNNIETNGLPLKPSANRRFLTITQRPKATYAHKQGETLHLVCDALGAPAPSVHWFKNDAPVYEYDVESNELIDSNPTSVARVTSRLLVSRTSGQDVYTCLITSGSKTARSTSIVYSADGSTELSERSKLYPLVPRIVVWYKVYVDTIESNIVLPCRVKGHPRPHVAWRDNKGNIVKNDSRMKVLRSGELVISGLRWSDMGEYICLATNVFGTAATKTFVYPAKAG